MAVASCRKNPVPDVNYPIPQEAMDYCYFKPGSYWVYEESTSHVLDSVYVTSAVQNFQDMLANPDYLGGHYWYYTVRMHSSYYDCDYERTVNMKSFFNHAPSSQVSIIQTREVDNTKGPFMNDILYTPIQQYMNGWGVYFKTDSVFYNPDNAIYIQGPLTFTHVLVLTNPRLSYIPASHSNLYLVPHVGIVKRELLDVPEVWNLIKYQVFQ